MTWGSHEPTAIAGWRAGHPTHQKYPLALPIIFSPTTWYITFKIKIQATHLRNCNLSKFEPRTILVANPGLVPKCIHIYIGPTFFSIQIIPTLIHIYQT